MKRSGILALVLLALTLAAQKFDFKTMQSFKPDPIGETYVNPTGNYALEPGSGVRLAPGSRIMMDYKTITPGKHYRLSGRVKGSGTMNMQIEWLKTATPQNNYQSLKLNGQPQRILIDAVAPEGTQYCYLIFYPAGESTVLVEEIDMVEITVDPDAPLLDFETPLLQPGSVGNYFVNPIGEFRYDDSGNHAKNGVGAMQLSANGRITMDYKPVTPGKRYELSVWMKGSRLGFAQMQWMGSLEKPQLDTKSIQLTSEYQLLKVSGIAPAGATHVYLHLFTDGQPESSLYLDDVRFTELATPAAAATVIDAVFTDGHERFSVYRDDEPVRLQITGRGLAMPDQLQWSVTDFQQNTVAAGTIPVTPESLTAGNVLELPRLPAGSFELAMKLKNSGGTIPFKGSRQPGFVSFGVLPMIKSLPLATPEASRFGGQGTNFITGGEFMKGDPYAPFYPTVGMNWTYFGGGNLAELESTPGKFQPKTREEYQRAGSAPFTAVNRMAELHDLHGVPRHLLKLPPYLAPDAKLNNTQLQSYPLADAPTYAELIGRVARDLAARREAYFPQRTHNYFQLHWEPDWHWNGTDDEFLQYYQAAYPALKANDPQALLLGPNYGVIARGDRKLETLFQKGLGKVLDGVLMHLYFLPVRSEPEAAGLPEDCRKLRKMVDQYIAPGAPLINTEWGVDYRGKDTADITRTDLLNHLSRFTRGHLIALGEGFDATWFFYTADYCTYQSTSGEQGYGIAYNTSSYINQHQFGAASIEPKPTMMGAAAMTRLLEGTRTLGRLDHLDPAIYAYTFRRGDDNLVAVWTPGKPRIFQLPTGNTAVTVYDIMGNPRTIATDNGVLTLELSPFVQYITGVADSVLPTAQRTPDSRFKQSRATVAPGGELAPLCRTIPAKLELVRNGEITPLTTPNMPENLAAGCYELRIPGVESMLIDLTGSAAIELPRLSSGNVEFAVENLTRLPRWLTVTARYDGREFHRETRNFPAGKTVLTIPLSRLPYDGLSPQLLSVTVADEHGEQAKCERSFAAIDVPATTEPPAWSRLFGKETITYQAKHHRGMEDFSARYAVSANAETLLLTVQVTDDRALDTDLPDQPWRNDSLIIAVGTEPDDQGEFAKVRKFAVSRQHGGAPLVQEIFGTPPKATLKTDAIRATLTRDEARQLTQYQLEIPRAIAAGLGITIHDVDTQAEITGDLHREMSLAGGVPLFMGNVKFAMLNYR